MAFLFQKKSLRCLLDRLEDGLVIDSTEPYYGQIHDARKQCQHLFGAESLPCFVRTNYLVIQLQLKYNLYKCFSSQKGIFVSFL
jgi:hypothetical protein